MRPYAGPRPQRVPRGGSLRIGALILRPSSSHHLGDYYIFSTCTFLYFRSSIHIGLSCITGRSSHASGDPMPVPTPTTTSSGKSSNESSDPSSSLIQVTALGLLDTSQLAYSIYFRLSIHNISGLSYSFLHVL
jgi:hypothetical protein